MDAILERRSVRNFNLNKMIPNEILVDLVRYGEAAGTARRQKSREYIIIENKKIIEELSNIYTRSTMRVNECNQIIAVIGKDPNTLPCPSFEAADLALATQNIMVKAVEYGIGSVMLGTYPDEERTSKANKVLDLKDNKFVYTFICLGYPKDDNAFYDMKKFDESVISYLK
jgi:nitroreductase